MRAARKGFTIVELMIAIVIFGVGIVGVYALVQSSIATSARARDEAVAANLVRERLELAHWLRDANWNAGQGTWTGTTAVDGVDAMPGVTEFGSGFWTVENDFRSGKALRLRKVDLASESPADFGSGSAARLWMDAQGRMVHAADPVGLGATPWDAYVKVEPVEYPAGTAREALRVTAVAVREGKNAKAWRASTLLTNWKR